MFGMIACIIGTFMEEPTISGTISLGVPFETYFGGRW